MVLGASKRIANQIFKVLWCDCSPPHHEIRQGDETIHYIYTHWIESAVWIHQGCCRRIYWIVCTSRRTANEWKKRDFVLNYRPIDVHRLGYCKFTIPSPIYSKKFKGSLRTWSGRCTVTLFISLMILFDGESCNRRIPSHLAWNITWTPFPTRRNNHIIHWTSQITCARQTVSLIIAWSSASHAYVPLCRRTWQLPRQNPNVSRRRKPATEGIISRNEKAGNGVARVNREHLVPKRVISL